MARIEARCPDCGRVRLAAHEAVLVVFATALGLPSGLAMYDFECPVCGDDVSIGCDTAMTSRLIRAGVRVVVELDPRQRHPSVAGARLADAAQRRARGAPHRPERFAAVAAPLTRDDLLDFHLGFQRDDWFDELAGAPDR